MKMTKGTRREKCASVWKCYKVLCKLEQIRRRGVETHGICTVPAPDEDQNVLEHSGTAASTAGLMYAMFPELRPLFPEEYLLLLLLHDIGETAIGDIPDDGSADAATTKDVREYEFMSDFMEFFEDDMSSKILRGFVRLQNKNDILYLTDKLDWILFVGHLTPYDKAGSMTFKAEHFGLTKQDEHNISISGTMRVVDAMVVHFMEHSKGIAGRDIYVDVIKAMYEDIDGAVPAFVSELI